MKNFDTKFYYELTEIALSFVFSIFLMFIFEAAIKHQISIEARIIVMICPALLACIYRVRQLIKKYL